MSKAHVSTGGQVEDCSLCYFRRSYQCPRSGLPPEAMLRSLAHAAAGHVEVCSSAAAGDLIDVCDPCNH